MPTIGSGRINTGGTLTFPAETTTTATNGLTSFTLITPTQGTNLFENFMQDGGDVTLSLRSITAGTGIQLQVTDGIIYVSLNDAAKLEGPTGPAGPPGPAMTLSALLTLLSTAPVLSTVSSSALSLVEDGKTIGWAQVAGTGGGLPTVDNTLLLEDSSGSLFLEDQSGYLVLEG